MLKLPFFNPTSPHHHASSRIFTRTPLRYVTPDADTLLYHLFLFSEAGKKPEDNPSSEDPMVKKKSHFTILKFQNVKLWMFTFIHLNFEWKHSNLRLRLSLLCIKIIDKYKMIAKILWPLIQLNLPIMFYINEIPILSQ